MTDLIQNRADTQTDAQRTAAAMEALLFAAGEAQSAAKLAAALEVKPEEIGDAARLLRTRYADPACGIELAVFGDSYQLCTKKEFYPQLISLVQKKKEYHLTDTVMETLSIIAYKQPVTKAEIEKIRGVSCDFAVNRLVEFGLVQELGRLNAPGRQLLFGITEEFLRVFGVSDTDELPLIDPLQAEQFRREAEEEAASSSEEETVDV